MIDVAVVGSYVQDLAFRTEVFPAPGETRIGHFLSGPGGKGFNQAVACHRQDISTRFIGAVGSDVFSAGLRDFIKHEGISASLMNIPEHSTGVASIVVDGSGQNQIIVDLGANNYLSPEFVETELGHPKIVLIQVESNLAAAQRALELGKERSALNILNPAPINQGINTHLLLLADIITPNETEFLFLQSHLHSRKLKDDFWNESDEELHQLCRQLFVPKVILTLGSQGCFVSLEQESFRVAPIKAEAKDTTGAGDAFSGGLAAGMVKFNYDILAAVKYATVVAGLSTEKVGTAPSMPMASEVKKQLLKDF